MAGTLALVPASSSSEARPEDELVSLPYIDQLSTAENQMVERLLQEEAARGDKQPHDYLKELSALPPLKFQGHTALQAEWARVRAGAAMEKLAFGNTMAPEPPQAQLNNVPAWRASHENACAQLEHQQNWLLNLELAQKYGPRAWQAHIESLTSAHSRLNEQVNETDRQIEAINRARSLSQTGAAGSLSSIQSDWAAQVAKNQAIEAACREMEARLEQLRPPPAELSQPATAGVQLEQ